MPSSRPGDDDVGDDIENDVRRPRRRRRDIVRNRIALLQMPVTYDKSTNVRTAREYVAKAYEAGAEVCVLPEIWNSPYATSAFPEYAEFLPDVGDAIYDENDENDQNNEGRRRRSWGESSIFLMDVAKSTGMYVIGGSVPEKVVVVAGGGEGRENHADDDDVRYYNTCLVVDPKGTVVGKHRKLHLFDVSVPGGIHFMESDTLTMGDLGPTYFDVISSGRWKEDAIEDEEGEGGGNGGGDRGGGEGLGRIGVGIWYVTDARASHAPY
jgi:predicted amidohydrolase